MSRAELEWRGATDWSTVGRRLRHVVAIAAVILAALLVIVGSALAYAAVVLGQL